MFSLSLQSSLAQMFVLRNITRHHALPNGSIQPSVEQRGFGDARAEGSLIFSEWLSSLISCPSQRVSVKGKQRACRQRLSGEEELPSLHT